MGPPSIDVMMPTGTTVEGPLFDLVEAGGAAFDTNADGRIDSDTTDQVFFNGVKSIP